MAETRPYIPCNGDEGWPGNPCCTAFESRMPSSVRRAVKTIQDKRQVRMPL